VYSYRAYSLNISSEFQFPELSSNSSSAPADLKIVFGTTPRELVGPNVLRKVRNESCPGKFLIHIKNAGRVYISDGTKITIEIFPGGDTELIKSFILTRAFAAAAHQRRWTPIHASAIEVNNKAVLFAGDSGAGKSTTVGAFVQAGYSFISDDISVIKQAEKNDQYKIYPSYPQIRLWEDSVALLRLSESTEKKPIRKKVKKYGINPTSNIIRTGLSISNVYILRWHQNDKIKIESPSKVHLLQELLSLTYAKNQLEGLGGHKEQFETLSYLIKECRISIVSRPLGSKNLGALISLLEEDFLL